MYRHHRAVHKIESCMTSGELGPVDDVHAAFNACGRETASATDATRNWRQRKECGGGIPYDFACHCVNACQHFTEGIPVRVTCRGGKSSRYDTNNRVLAIIEHQNGCMGILESSKKAGWNHEVQVACAHATLRLPVAWSIADARDGGMAGLTLCQPKAGNWSSRPASAISASTSSRSRGASMVRFCRPSSVTTTVSSTLI